MSTSTPGTIPPPSPTIPLTVDARAAYEALSKQLQDSIENTADLAVLEALNPAKQNVDNILTKDNMYRLHANTDLFNALLKQINETNNDLQKLKDQIKAIESHFTQAGAILGAIKTVLTLLPVA